VPIFLWLNVIEAYEFDKLAAARSVFRTAREERDHERLDRVRWEEQHGAEASFACGMVLVPETEGMLPRPATRPAAVPPPPPPASAPSSHPARPTWTSGSGAGPATAASRADVPAGATDVPPGAADVPPAPVPPPQAEAPPLTRPAQVTASVLREEVVFLLEDGIGDVEEGGRVPRAAIADVDVVDVRGAHVPEPAREAIEPSQLVFTVLRWTNEGVPDEERFAFRSPWLAWGAARRLLEAKRVA
jgi:hypothetical protein